MEPSTTEVDAAGLEFIASDGQPMAETSRHAGQMADLRQSLITLARWRGWSDAYVGMNQFFYWDPRSARARLAPDVYFYRSVAEPERPRPSWKLWVEGKGPDLVVEVASSGTWKEDVGHKREVYRDVFRVREYVFFDPDPDDPIPGGPLLGWRLKGDVYRRAGTTSRFGSQVLGADLVVRDGELRIVEADGRLVPGTVLEGLDLGKARGRAEGHAEGRVEGHTEGHAEGHAEGRVEGHAEGRVEGHAEGRVEGHAEGRVEEARAMVQRLLRLRFQDVPTRLLARLDGASLEDLRRWTERAIVAATPDDVFREA